MALKTKRWKIVATFVALAVVLALGMFAVMFVIASPAPWAATIEEVTQSKGPEPASVVNNLPTGGILVKRFERRISFMFDATYEGYDAYLAAWSVQFEDTYLLRPSQFGRNELVTVQTNIPMDGGKRLSTLNWFVILDGPLKGNILLKDVPASGETKHVLYSPYRACPESKSLHLDTDPKPVPKSLVRAPEVVCSRAANVSFGK
jgi:hypothetical protein